MKYICFVVRIRIFLVIVSLIFGCKSVQVDSFYNENVDFGNFYTYRVDNPLNKDNDFSEKGSESHQLIENAIRNQMDAKQYLYSSRADLVVNYQIVLDSKVDYNVSRVSSPYYNPYYGSGYPYYGVSQREFKEGVLILDIKDKRNRKLLWQGSIDLKINKKYKKHKQDIIDQTIALILNDYPFVAGQTKPVSKTPEEEQ